MKVELSISDVHDLLEMYFEKYTKSEKNYFELHDKLSGHSDEFDAEKCHQLYQCFRDMTRYAAKHRHWRYIYNQMKDSRE